MANSGGGWIVFGVVEDNETSAASKLKPIRWNSDEHQRILRTAYARVSPPVLGLEFFALPLAEGHVVLMRVPDSRDAPHFARKGNDAFVAPRRNGPHTAFMSERDIERGFRERFQRRDDDERELQQLFEETGKSLNPSDGVCCVLVAIPNEPTSVLPALTEDVVYKYVSLPNLPELVYSSSGALLRWDRGQVRKGLRKWVIRSFAGNRFPYRKSLFDDSTVACSYQLGIAEDIAEARPYLPVGESNHCMVSDIESAVIDFFSLLRAYAAERQSHAGFRIRVGLMGDPEKPIYIRTTTGGSNLLLDIEYSDPIDSFQPVTVELDSLTEFEELLPTINDITRDIINQSGLTALRVMAEPGDNNMP
ncbi:Uncharacterised protein [Trueperella bialowiezensis]|uniref:Schlafen AlbA-2 domain-containing protein n=2 Tax=Trueperella bialowiezensis TaxID=312285 RepID=A0A448PG14_9ACTO|nr:Uncharacterised protein [Trueperella bialowiezensis]